MPGFQFACTHNMFYSIILARYGFKGFHVTSDTTAALMTSLLTEQPNLSFLAPSLG